jgi:hypothetical protein
MKKLLVVTLMSFAGWGCESSSKPEEKIVVTTPIGRKESTTRRYTIREIEAEAASPSVAKNPFDIQHPVYPSKDQIESLKQRLKGGGEIWYFQGLDSGWAIVKNHEVLCVLVTSHEY